MDYRTAQAEFDAIKDEIEKLARQISFVARALESEPGSLKVSPADPCPPVREQAPGDYCIESGHWPSADTIANLLAHYRAAKSRLTA